MKFEQYLNEVVKPIETKDEILKLIEKNCKYYLSLTKNGEYKFYRGIKKIYVKFGEKSVRQDRVPRGMEPKQAKILNDWLLKNGHIDRSKSVFANSDKTKLGLFSSMQYEIFPIGKFNYTYVKAFDINMTSNSEYKDAISALMYGKSYIGNYEEEIKQAFVTNKGIKEAHDKKYEIWFDCKKYYCIEIEEGK